MTLISSPAANLGRIRFGSANATVSTTLGKLKEAVNNTATRYTGELPGYEKGFSVNGRSLRLRDGRGMSTIETTTATGEAITIHRSTGFYEGVTVTVGGRRFESDSRQDAATFDEIAAALRSKVPSSKPPADGPNIDF